MREQLEKRLAELEAEFESGQRMMAELDAKQANLRDTLLRIKGAIQVVEELLGRESEPPTEGEAGGEEAEPGVEET